MAPPEMVQLLMLANVRKPTFLHKRLTNQQEVIGEEIVGGGIELVFLELQPTTPWEVLDNKWNYKRLENCTSFLDTKDHEGMCYLKGLVNLFLNGMWVDFSLWKEEGRVGQQYF